jgi:hypothetical protein
VDIGNPSALLSQPAELGSIVIIFLLDVDFGERDLLAGFGLESSLRKGITP